MRFALLFLAACAPELSHTAATTFASIYSCPLERETVTPMPPPTDIAADPGRAAVWNEHHHVFTVTGCGATLRFDCNVVGGDASNPAVDCN